VATHSLLTLANFKAKCDGLQSSKDEVEAKRTELTAVINDRDSLATELKELCTRARSGFRATYGPDSTEYEQAGGKRASERKRPVRQRGSLNKAA
jgi:hypothetical protein